MKQKFAYLISSQRFEKLSLLCIILLAILLRFLFLNSFPTAIGGDELTYVLNAKAFFLTGHDITGSIPWYGPLLFRYPAGTLPQAELPYFLLLPFVGPFPFSLILTRLPNALLSVGIVGILYLITKQLFNKHAALFTALLSAINPWFIFISRTAYEMVPAMFFYLFAFYILLRAKEWKILLAFPFLLLAFYSYIASKLFFLPFVFIVCFYMYWFVFQKKYLKHYLILCGLSVLLIVIFLVLLIGNSHATRLSELLTMNAPQITKEVDAVRRASLHMSGAGLFENKGTVLFRILITKLFAIFSFTYLFLTGDAFFSIWRHGLFYAVDVIFLITGSVSLFFRKKQLFFFLLVLICISVLPHLLHSTSTDNFTPHITMLFPFFLILMGYGMSIIIEKVKNQRVALIAVMSIIVLYGILLLNFLQIYFLQFPLKGYFDFPVRIVSAYIVLAKQTHTPVTIYSSRSTDLFEKYVFYTNAYTSKTTDVIKEQLTMKDPHIEELHFTDCHPLIDPAKQQGVSIIEASCSPLKHESVHETIPQLSDGGTTFRIYHDPICKNDLTTNYLTTIHINSFAIERLPKDTFCQSFLTF